MLSGGLMPFPFRSLSAGLCFVIASTATPLSAKGRPDAQANAGPEDRLRAEATAWVERGSVEPYRLLSLPSRSGERLSVGVVYTPLVRLALRIQAAMRDGRNPDEVTTAEIGPEVFIVWESDPEFSTQPPCTDIVSGPTVRMGLRFRDKMIRPFKTVSFDAQRNHARLAGLGYADTSTARALAVVSPDELAQDSVLSWAVSYQCADSRTITQQRFAYVGPDDLAAWR